MINIKDLNVRDPFVVNENGVYYLFASYKGENDDFPSFVCYKSVDLENFEDPKYIFTRPENFWATKQFWAPEVHKYKGKYYLFASLKSDDKCRGTQIFVCDTIDGNYIPLKDEPITPRDWECLDGTLYVENGVPYIIFCHEWLQVNDGKMYAARMSDDLKDIVGEPIYLFAASDAKWVRPFCDEINYVTDGPFIIKKDDKLQMIWSSYAKDGYAVGVCESKSIEGPWIQKDEPIYSKNGGHAMVFVKDGIQMLSLHTPNDPDGAERPLFIPLENI